MVDLGEGARGIRFDPDEPPVGYGPSVAAAADAWLLLALSVWPRMVELADDCDRVPVVRCHARGDDLAGSVRLTLARRDGVQQTFLGAGEVCVVGEVPSRWWGWRTRDGAPVLHRDRGAVDTALAENMLTYDGTHRTRKVLLLGGPQDGDELETDCLELEMPGVLVGGKWHRPGDVDPELAAVMTRHVFYRVRQVDDLDRTGPWWDEERLADREWVATFEGERPLEGGWPPEGWVDIGTTTDEHVQLGGEADPDDVLVAIVDGMDSTGYPGPLDATSRCGGLVESALDVQRVLLERFVLHPRPTA